MSRRPAIRRKDVDAFAAALEARGLRPCAVDYYPTGKVRFHLVPPADDETTTLDRELAEFEKQNGAR
jgi:hypothetical protein